MASLFALVCQDRIIVNSDPAYYNDLVAFCKNTTKIIQIQGGVIVVNKWIRKMGMSLSVIMAAAQMSGGMVYAAPETEEQGSFLEEEQDLPKVENVNCMFENGVDDDCSGVFMLSWEPVERTINDEKVSPDYYEVYVNNDKDKTLVEQRKNGTPVWKVFGKPTTNNYIYKVENMKPGDIYNFRICAVYDGEIYAVSEIITCYIRYPDDWWMCMDRNELFLQEGDTGMKTAYAGYWGDTEVEWRSEDETIATVEVINEGRSAIIHALRPGTTTVTVGVPGVVVTDRCTVTVSTDKPVEDAKRDEPDMVREPDGTVCVVMKDGSTKDHFTGMADYEGGKFLMVEGAVAKEVNGAQLDPVRGDIFYFLANGQVQYYYEGLAEYNGKWFYIKDGAVQTQMNALVDYDGGKFLVAVGRIVDEYNGLAQDPQNTQTGDWYYFADGQAQTQYTGLVRYDNAWFYVINGKLAADFNGSVDYDGATFRVENGMVK